MIRLLHLHDACDDMASQLAHGDSLSWRLSLAMELVASPSLLIIHGAHPSESCTQILIMIWFLETCTQTFDLF